MSETAWANLVLGLLAGVVLLQALVLLLKPSLWIAWFVAKPWKPFGVDVKIVDANRLKRKARVLGVVQLGVLGLGALVYGWSCGASCRP